MDANWWPLVGLVCFSLVAALCEGHDAEADKIQFEAAFQEINSTASPPSLEDLKLNGVEDIIYQKDAVMDVLEYSLPNGTAESNDIPPWAADGTTAGDGRIDYTTQGPRLEQKLTSVGTDAPRATSPISTAKPCPLDCGPGGGCTLDDSEESPACLCPLGKGGEKCVEDKEIQSPRFTGSSWLAFPALRGAYKHVQLSLELRPEAYDGIFFLTGERDDMAGDFMALLLHQGFVEFRFDCGSGVGVVRSQETVFLNQWNHITLYRHRWDAWLQLNGGKHVQGRSKGLFSRITFREPLFIGGPGNTTGLPEKLPVARGLRGCIRHLEVNDHAYKFPPGTGRRGYQGIWDRFCKIAEECTADRCSRVPCQHGGKCLTSDNSAVCLCPLGFSGDLCEIRVDLQVPSFNGSSHLRYRGLAETALTWLDLDITFKPTAPDGLIIYNGHRMDGTNDFMGLYLNDGYVEFSYNLGTGAIVARSQFRIMLSEWHQVRVSRTGRLAILTVDNQLPVEVLSPGAFTQLSLPQNLYLGGVPNFGIVSPQIKIRTAFVGCVQKVRINGRPISILAEALGGRQRGQLPAPVRRQALRRRRRVRSPAGLFHVQMQAGLQRPPVQRSFKSYTITDHPCKPGYRDHLCSRGPPSFYGTDSYLYLHDSSTVDAVSSDPLVLNVRFKTSSEFGLLLWASGGGSFLSLGLERGALVLRFSVRGRREEIHVVHNTTTVHDGLWHRIKAVKDGSAGLLIVDNGSAVTRQSLVIYDRPSSLEDDGLYIGGMPKAPLKALTKYGAGIKGCIADLVINADYHLQLVNHSEIGHNIGECEA
ncbi:hypothetical protein NQ318_003842 [Aromia moschata]|uniref:Pikachurin n=1 Tax=Aromia moschata TaxID=1265417 RepID=A0AAV8Z762_9CUCU|nr:hypothetical protein NQ318_003842 [Aromia moschata]